MDAFTLHISTAIISAMMVVSLLTFYFVGNRDTGYLPKIKCKGVSFKTDSCKYVPNTYQS